MRRPLYGWLLAQGISLTGTRVSMIALPLFVLETTGSATRTGVVALAETLPLVLTKVLGGPVIDRVGPRRVAVTCDLASVLTVGTIPLLHLLDVLTFPVLLVLVAMSGALRGPGDGALNALVPSLVESAGVPMERATGLEGTVERTAALAGAAIGGVLVGLLGGAGALVVDALSFLAAAVVLLWATHGLRPVRAVGEVPADTETGYLRRLREGWDFLRRDRVLFGITVMVALTNLIDAAYVSVLLPVWAVTTGRGAAGVALALGVFGGSAAIGAATAAVWAARLPRFKVYLLAFLLAGAPRYVVFALDSPVVAILGVCAVGGFASGFINPVLGAVTFERIPAQLVGRVTSMQTATCYALMPFGGLLGGLLVTGTSLPVAMAVSGAAYFLVTMLPAVDPRWRELDRRPDPVASGSQPGPDGEDRGLHAVAAPGLGEHVGDVGLDRRE